MRRLRAVATPTARPATRRLRREFSARDLTAPTSSPVRRPPRSAAPSGRSAARRSTRGWSARASCSSRWPASGPTATGSCGEAGGRGAAALLVGRARRTPARSTGSATSRSSVVADGSRRSPRRPPMARPVRPARGGHHRQLAKTSTKEADRRGARARAGMLRNDGNENNEIGLPLTLLRLGPEHEAAVLEMGMYVPGDIAVLARVARPADRRRHRGAGDAPRARRLAGCDRARQARAGRGAAATTATAVLNADDAARPRGWPSHARRASSRYGFAPRRRRAAERGRVAGGAGHALPARSPAAAAAAVGRDPGARPALRPQRAGRGRGRAWPPA